MHKKKNKELSGKTSSFSGKCSYCGKEGHRISECHKEKSDEEIAKVTIKQENLLIKKLN